MAIIAKSLRAVSVFCVEIGRYDRRYWDGRRTVVFKWWYIHGEEKWYVRAVNRACMCIVTRYLCEIREEDDGRKKTALSGINS